MKFNHKIQIWQAYIWKFFRSKQYINSCRASPFPSHLACSVYLYVMQAWPWIMAYMILFQIEFVKFIRITLKMDVYSILQSRVLPLKWITLNVKILFQMKVNKFTYIILKVVFLTLYKAMFYNQKWIVLNIEVWRTILLY